LLEETGGDSPRQIPVGDPTLSDKEIISNESQERMGVGHWSRKILRHLKKYRNANALLSTFVGESLAITNLSSEETDKGKKPFDLRS
jgi:phosphoribosylformylglycinamidine synthase